MKMMPSNPYRIWWKIILIYSNNFGILEQVLNITKNCCYPRTYLGERHSFSIKWTNKHPLMNTRNQRANKYIDMAQSTLTSVRKGWRFRFYSLVNNKQSTGINQAYLMHPMKSASLRPGAHIQRTVPGRAWSWQELVHAPGQS